MLFPEKHIKRGNFSFHSGSKGTILYDVNSLLTDKHFRDHVLNAIPFSPHYVGIATGGALVALLIAQQRDALFSMVKDKELKGEMPKGEWLLIDDVTTTESSLKDALEIIPSKPQEIFVVVDRRTPEYKTLSLASCFEVMP